MAEETRRQARVRSSIGYNAIERLQLGGRKVSVDTVVLNAVVRQDGSLELGQKIPLAPGPVELTVRAISNGQKENVLDVLNRIRREQQANGHVARSRDEIDAEVQSIRGEWDEQPSARVVFRKASSTSARALSRRLCSGHKRTPWAVKPSGHSRIRPIGSTAFTTSKIVNSAGDFINTMPPPKPRLERSILASRKPCKTFER
jgi:hypothetical protein